MRRYLLGMILISTVMAGEAAEQVSPNVEQTIRDARAAYEQIEDYTCTLHRRERFGGKLEEKGDVIFKYMKPRRFYMKWPKESIEAIYAEGSYDDRMVIHGGWLFKYLSVAVDPALALKSNRHTLLEADIGHILDVLESNYRLARMNGDARIAFEGREFLDGREVLIFHGLFPPGKGYYGHRVRVDIDREYRLPVRITVHGWANELLEMYHYTDMTLNAGLTKRDFDVSNDAYLFRLGSRVEL